jgi:heme/copper-type cytochrome/quinol oxidase subunit 2
MKKIIGTIIAITFFLATAIGLAVPALASADSVSSAKNSVCSTINGGACDASSASSIHNLVVAIINILSLIVGIVSVVMIIFGGFKYVTSGGDSGNVSSAKNTIIYAVIGLIVVALAQFLVLFVINNVSPKPTTNNNKTTTSYLSIPETNA